MNGFLAALPLLATALPAAPALSEGPDREALAKAWLEQHAVEAEGKGVPEVIAAGHVHWRLGPFDLQVPPAALREWDEEVVHAAEGLLAVVGVWLDWLPAEGDDPRRAAAEKARTLLHEHLRGFSPRDLAKLEPEPGADLWTLLEPDEGIRTAVETLWEWFAAGGPVAPQGDEAAPVRRVGIVLAPSRGEFVRVLSVVGLVDEPWRSEYWSEDSLGWTHAQWGDLRFVSLTFAKENASEVWEEGTSMTQKNKRALDEHVVQLGARTLFERHGVPSLFAVALANNVTIHLFGEVDTRNDGDTRARSIEAVSVFIPGALSDGVLPAANADSRWRREKGEGYFVPVLRKGQKDGAKKARSKWQKKAFFVLEGEKGGRHYVQAPFFGAGEDVPEEYHPDFTEFQRAYRSGFLHWLREHGVEEDPEASQRAFATFLKGIALSAEPDLGQALAAAYDEPLSKKDLDENTLEGRFLVWLADQR